MCVCVCVCVYAHICFSGGASGKGPSCQCGRHKRCRFNSWIGKISWRRELLPTPAFLPGESHGQRNLAGYSPWDCKELDMMHTCLSVYLSIMLGSCGLAKLSLSHGEKEAAACSFCLSPWGFSGKLVAVYLRARSCHWDLPMIGFFKNLFMLEIFLCSKLCF